jgi:hypothetical protein
MTRFSEGRNSVLWYLILMILAYGLSYYLHTKGASPIRTFILAFCGGFCGWRIFEIGRGRKWK